jgi:exopolysaccharide production protein ExoQ
MQPIATLLIILGIVGLFWLERDRRTRTSGALWLPVVWLGLAGSRSVSQWLAMFGLTSSANLTPDQYLDGSPLDRNIYLVFILIAVIVLVQRQRKMATLLRTNGPILLFFFYCAFSVLWSDYPDVAFKRWIKAVGDLLMVLIVLSDADPVAAIRRLLNRVAFVLLPVSILFIKYYPAWGRDFHPNGAGAAWQPSYVGVTTSKNLLGMITLLLGLGSVAFVFQAYRRRKVTGKSGPLIAQCALLGMVIWLFWMVNSATAMSCFLMAGGLIAVTNLHRLGRKPATVHLLVAAAVSISLISLFLAPVMLGTLGRDSTLTGRTDIWILALGMAGNPLVGTGFESFWLGTRLEKVWNLYRFHLQEAHNGYLEIYLNLGWIGVALLASLLITGYRNLIAAFRRDPETASLKIAYFLVAIIYNLTEAGFRSQNPTWILFLLAIAAVPQPGTQARRYAPSADYTDDLAALEVQADVALSAGLREETI